jgi:hypothetical protein
MKKLIAIAVLFISLAAAAFAQDDSGWKVGFSAQFVTDMLYATSAKAKWENTPAGGETETIDLPGANKGTVNFFGNRDNPFHSGPGQRLLLSLSNSGENYDVYVDMKLDDWVSGTGGGTGGNEGWDGHVMSLINAGNADWYLKGTAGIFNAQLGTASYGGWVSTQATWNNWIGWNSLCRFGVWRAPGGGGDDFIVSDEFRTWNTWGDIFGAGITFADNFRFSVGYRINPTFLGWGKWNPNTGDPYESKSSFNGSFMFNARISDAIAFDLFYSVIGADNDTAIRPVSNYTAPPAFWRNTIGAYVGLNLIENLGISVGYTVNFNAYETGGYLDAANASYPERSQPVTWNAPIYSGIDIRVNFSGIDKLGLTFNNNVSFASVKSQKMEAGYNPVVTASLGESSVAGLRNFPDTAEGTEESWFHWEGELKASLGFIDGVGLTVHLADRLGVMTEDFVDPWNNNNTSNRVGTSNEFRVSVFADYGIGAVTVGAGLYLGLESDLYVGKWVTNNGTSTTSTSIKSDVVKFGIPILFKVAF